MSPPARHAALSEISPFDGGDLRVVIETPRGSRSKYSYNPDCDCMQLSTVLPEGMVFPYDFGFVPSTVGEDGDPLDVLVLMEASVIPGCVVRARLVGAIEAEQKGKSESWIRNDRLIAIATHAQTHDNAQKLSDLRPHERAAAFTYQRAVPRTPPCPPAGPRGPGCSGRWGPCAQVAILGR
jgi:inorganic pyrophosphatase